MPRPYSLRLHPSHPCKRVIRAMTHRERVLMALNHEEPDRVPIDFAAWRSSGIQAPAYAALRRHLGLGGDRLFRLYDLMEQLAFGRDGNRPNAAQRRLPRARPLPARQRPCAYSRIGHRGHPLAHHDWRGGGVHPRPGRALAPPIREGPTTPPPPASAATSWRMATSCSALPSS